jgi:hypothetical protein
MMSVNEQVRAFEQEYATRSGVTVEWLHSWGRFGAPCDCGWDRCRGFQMTYAWEDAIEEDRVRALPQTPEPNEAQ